MKGFVWFIFGAAAGGTGGFFVTRYFLNKNKRKEIDAEVESVKESLKNYYENKKVVKKAPDPEKPDARQQKLGTVLKPANDIKVQVTDYSKPKKEVVEEESSIEVISEHEYGDNDEFEQLEFALFDDGYLTYNDAFKEKVSKAEIETLLPKNYERMFDEEGYLYIKNTTEKTYILIIKVNQSYEQWCYDNDYMSRLS